MQPRALTRPRVSSQPLRSVDQAVGDDNELDTGSRHRFLSLTNGVRDAVRLNRFPGRLSGTVALIICELIVFEALLNPHYIVRVVERFVMLPWTQASKRHCVATRWQDQSPSCLISCVSYAESHHGLPGPGRCRIHGSDWQTYHLELGPQLGICSVFGSSPNLTIARLHGYLKYLTAGFLLFLSLQPILFVSILELDISVEPN